MTSEGLTMSKWKDGLPPVGEAVLVYEGSDEWVEAPIVAHDGDVAIYIIRKGVYGAGMAEVFKPLKSEADRKRDEQIKAINKFIQDWQLSSEPVERLGELLWFGDYRKVTPLTDEQIDDSTCCDLALYDRRSLAAGAKWARSQILGEES